MLCCSAQPLVLLTTEVEWESAEEIESPPPPLTAQYTALSVAQPMAAHSIHDWLMHPSAAHT